ncbi:(d)CMP kinase [Streptomyces virginiae]|uniref:(d)CMP kinase n=2 Tax=Streptomyces TaxID=1883 RepID=UPI00341808CF
MPALSISIDGPTASGKSTLAVALAQRNGLAFLDTGLSYRSLAYALHHTPGGIPRGELRHSLLHQPLVYSRPGAEQPSEMHSILFRGRNITQDIWAPELEGALKEISGDPEWRREILSMHLGIMEKYGNVVAVGRDVAATLLPGAAVHVYLTADLAIRRERRRAQYRGAENRSTRVGPATVRDIENRDMIRKLPTSMEIDSTYSPASAVIAAVMHRVEKAQNNGRCRP